MYFAHCVYLIHFHLYLISILKQIGQVNIFDSSLTPLALIKESPELGEILVSLAYLPSARRLNLDLLRGKQLLQTNLVGEPG